MKFLTLIYVILFGKKIGTDNFKNKYYVVKSKHKERRIVIFKGKNEASKVTPEWDGWLRFAVSSNVDSKEYFWQKRYLPNLTGTIFKYCKDKNTKKVSRFRG